MNEADSEFRVSVPIRYGRKSVTRGGSYTMVFSPEYTSSLGMAKVVRCKRDVTSIDDLTAEATELWVAESKETHRGRLSTGWGCVALLVSDTFLDGPDREERIGLLANWAERVAQEKNYGRAGFSAKDGEVAGGDVIVGGRL